MEPILQDHNGPEVVPGLFNKLVLNDRQRKSITFNLRVDIAVIYDKTPFPVWLGH